MSEPKRFQTQNAMLIPNIHFLNATDAVFSQKMTKMNFAISQKNVELENP